jgi:signal recognition particle receptor subunit alpha
MQNNEGLMKKLAQLVTINKPDLVLFVGEALCGNDGVDQLTSFNRSLADLTEDGRGIDGVILTKFDTVDDKVGAALSMVYAAGKPIVYIGTGERYVNLKKL